MPAEASPGVGRVRPHGGLVTAFAMLAVLHLRGDKCAIGSRALASLSLTARATCQLQTASCKLQAQRPHLKGLANLIVGCTAACLDPHSPVWGSHLNGIQTTSGFLRQTPTGFGELAICPCTRSSPDPKSATCKPRIAICQRRVRTNAVNNRLGECTSPTCESCSGLLDWWTPSAWSTILMLDD